MTHLKTPYYLIDEIKLLKNLKKIKTLRDISGAKSVLALKCFSTWSTFDLISTYMDGTTSSSVYEARLGYETFGKEVHAYSVAFSQEDIDELKQFSSKIIFNSISQLKRFHGDIKGITTGLRINPHISYSDFDLADPARRYSRLGETNITSIEKVQNLISGVMFHYNCENENFDDFSDSLDIISKKYKNILHKLKWISLGGGVLFTAQNYQFDKLCLKLKEFSEHFKIQIYLEPGEAVITKAATLVTRVLDIVHNEVDIAIVDSSIEPHMLDLLIYRDEAKLEHPTSGKYQYMIAGYSCLAGDIFGTYNFSSQLKIDELIHIGNAAGYTMVKKNWFNGLRMPSIVIRRTDGTLDLIKEFTYDDFKESLS